MAERCAVIGVGQTKYDAKRIDVSMPGLLREAALRALQDAEFTWADIDAVVIGKAPDTFEGMMFPENYLCDALGATGKPLLRVHTAGSVGGSTANVAISLVAAGVHERVLTIAWEKQSESNAMWGLTLSPPFSVAVVAGAGGFFAPLVRTYMHRSAAPEDTGILVALKDRRNALKNPYAHLQMPDVTYEEIRDSFMLWDPIRYLESCPSSDGACAMVLVNERLADRTARRPAWVHGTSMRSEPVQFAKRDAVNPMAGRMAAQDLYQQAGIGDPRKEIDCIECYVPFSWFEPMWMETMGFADEGEGWRLTHDGTTALDGSRPVNMSGGVLSSNPIGASGMCRYAEAANQVRGEAGEHQVDGARIALGHAYGGGSQYFSMALFGADKP